MQGRDFEVDGRAAGARLDAFLGERLGLSRAETRRLLARRVVSVDGRIRDAGAKGERLLMGARVEVAPFTPRADQRILPAPELALSVLAEGPDWLALDKPAGLPVHPYREEERATAAGFAVSLRPQLQGVGEGGLRSGVVHRLDVDTSGVLLLASEEAAWRRMRRAFRRHQVAKRYRAIAMGELEATGRVELGLRVAQHRPARVAVAEPGSARDPGGVRQTRLAWRVVERLHGGCLVEVDLETGFLHQVRISLAHLGAPLAGDRLYGPAPEEDPSGAGRHMLHAASVHWEGISADSPDPPDFAAVLERLRG
jgi:23S rRNA pseudouridine1911/1915/1917 synthase